MNFQETIGSRVEPDWPTISIQSEIEAPVTLQTLDRAEANLSQPISMKAPQWLGQYFAQILLSSHDPLTALLKMTSILGETFSASCCLIILDVAGQPKVQTIYWFPGEPTTIRLCQSSLNEFKDLTNHPAIPSTEMLVISDVETVEAGSDFLEGLKATSSILNLDLSQVRAILATKTYFQRYANGVIAVMRSQLHEWTQQEKHLLDVLSGQVAIAISQTQLHQQVQRQIQYQTLTDQLTRAIRSALELNEIFQIALDGIVSALQIDRGLVLLLKYTDPLLKSRGTQIPRAKVIVVTESPATPGNGAKPISQLPPSDDEQEELGTWINQGFWLSECALCQQALLQGSEPLIISDLNTTSINAASPPISSEQSVAPVFMAQTMPALLLMPLENQGTILGYLVLQYSQPYSWQAEEVTFARLVAAQLSTAIIQARTLRQVQALVEERTAQLKRSLDVQAKLYEKTRQQVEQLQRLNQIREEFLSTVSHELRTPLTSMTLAIRMLRQAELSPDRRTKYLDILEQQCAQETSLINDLLALQKLESRSVAIHLQKIDVKLMLQNLAYSFDETWATRQVKFELDLPEHSLPLHTDLESLQRLLAELLTNAGKYSDPGTAVRLSVAQRMEEQVCYLVLRLCNIGAGIAPEELPYIFDKFRRGAGMTQKAIQGTGLGLALVKGLAEHLNGTIKASSHPLEQSQSWETCFTLILPQFPSNFTYPES